MNLMSARFRSSEKYEISRQPDFILLKEISCQPDFILLNANDGKVWISPAKLDPFRCICIFISLVFVFVFVFLVFVFWNPTRRAWPLPFWFSLRPRPVLTWWWTVLMSEWNTRLFCFQCPRMFSAYSPSATLVIVIKYVCSQCPRILSGYSPSATLPLRAILLHLSRLRASLLLLL